MIIRASNQVHHYSLFIHIVKNTWIILHYQHWYLIVNWSSVLEKVEVFCLWRSFLKNEFSTSPAHKTVLSRDVNQWRDGWSFFTKLEHFFFLKLKCCWWVKVLDYSVGLRHSSDVQLLFRASFSRCCIRTMKHWILFSPIHRNKSCIIYEIYKIFKSVDVLLFC